MQDRLTSSVSNSPRNHWLPLQIENLVLRHELAVLRRQHPRPRLQPEEGTLLASLSGLLHRSLGHDTPVPTVRELERVRPPPVSCAAGTSPVD